MMIAETCARQSRMVLHLLESNSCRRYETSTRENRFKAQVDQAKRGHLSAVPLSAFTSDATFDERECA